MPDAGARVDGVRNKLLLLVRRLLRRRLLLRRLLDQQQAVGGRDGLILLLPSFVLGRAIARMLCLTKSQ
eukprot:SAG22_NODE_8058_length_686_cov_162.604770_1_plen_69_part_00